MRKSFHGLREKDARAGAPGLICCVRASSTLSRMMISYPAFAWGIAVALLIGSAGYFDLSPASVPTDAAEILNKSIRMQKTLLQGETEHQVISIDERANDGSVLQQEPWTYGKTVTVADTSDGFMNAAPSHRSRVAQ